MPDEQTESAPIGHATTVHWLADYVYGTIATLVAIAGLTFESHPGELTTAGVVIVGAIAIWFAHTLSRLVSLRSQGNLELHWANVRSELRSSWSIVTAAIPATVVFILAALHVWTIHAAFVIADAIGVLALAVVGIGTAGGRDRPLHRRIAYVCFVVLVGVLIVAMEAGSTSCDALDDGIPSTCDARGHPVDRRCFRPGCRYCRGRDSGVPRSERRIGTETGPEG